MRSHTTPGFRDAYEKLSPEMRSLVRKNYRLWTESPFHNSLEFKKLFSTKPFWSARCGRDFRVVGYMKGNCMHWFFVGSHADYDRLLKKL